MRVVNGAGDFPRGQALVARLGTLASNVVLVVDVFAAFGFVRGHDSGDLLQQARVFGGVRTPRALPVCEIAKLDAQNSRLNLVEAAVPPGLTAQVLGGLAVIAKRAKARSDFRRVRDNHSRVTVRAKVFRRVKAKAGGVAERADTAPPINCPNGLRAVLDERQFA